MKKFLPFMVLFTEMINYIELLKSNPQYFKQFSCRELLFLNYDCPVKVNKITKWSEQNYFYYVLTGQKTMHTVNKSWHMTAGTFSFVKKGAVLIEQFYLEPFCIVVFVMPDSFISRFISTYKDRLPAEQPHNKPEDLVMTIKTDDMLVKFCESVLPYFTSETPPSEQLIELKFHELLLHILNNSENADLISYLHSVASQKAYGLEQMMESNFNYNLGLEEYAKLCNRSLSSFKRDFQLAYKTTPGKWLLKKRLEHAHRLLVETEKQISDVLLESGFENQAHFSKAFKKHFGHSPLQYRKKLESIRA